jgi:hypothetical protein
VSEAIESVTRVLALGAGRDPAEATKEDRDRAVDFVSCFHAALYWARRAEPCGHCHGSGVEPRRVQRAPPLAVAVAS